MAPIQTATQKMPNPTQGPMVPQNAEAGSIGHEIKLVCECFPLGEPAQQKPASWLKIQKTPATFYRNNLTSHHFTFQAEVPGGRTSGVVGKTSEARWLVSYLGGHWMEDKWPDKKEEVVCYSGMVFFAQWSGFATTSSSTFWTRWV